MASSSSSSALSAEQQVAISAVLKASAVAQRVQADLIDNEKATKSDNSPVTVADYAAQALVSKLIFAHFDYKLVGEEDSKDLASEEQRTLREKITELANWAIAQKSDDHNHNSTPAAWDKVGQAALDETVWLEAIDKGDATTTQEGRVWALDPIDGTKGFLRQGQYAVCLALLEQGSPVLGVIGCPNLPVDFKNPSSSEKGVVFVAVKGQGAFQRSFSDPTLHPISMSTITDLTQASFCESVESGHSDQSTNANIAKALGITRPPTRMDSQAKYCSISRADGDIYLRLPVKKDYEEKIWDHAAGALLVEEAGGKVTDVLGKPLDFSLGRTLKANKGVVASVASIHNKVIEAVKKAMEGSSVL